MSSFDDELVALADQQRELTDLLAGRSDADWDLPSACESWSVGDVVLHLIQTNDMALASAEGRLDALLNGPFYAPDLSVTTLDGIVDLAVQRARGDGPAELMRRWVEGAAAMTAALEAAGPSARLQWVVGELSARTLVSTRIAETWIHTGDAAFGLGVDLPPTDRLELIARLSWRTLPHAFGREGLTLAGPVGFDLVGPAGQAWRFGVDGSPVTVVTGTALDLCRVASRRVDPADTALVATGPDAAAVLAYVRTWA